MYKVKRYQKLPINSNRHWAHVVDARAGPGVKNFVKVLPRFSENISNNEYSSGETSRELSGESDEAKARVPSAETREWHLDLL